MNHAFITFCVLEFIALLVAAREHGTPKRGKNSFWAALFGGVVSILLMLWAIHWSING